MPLICILLMILWMWPDPLPATPLWKGFGDKCISLLHCGNEKGVGLIPQSLAQISSSFEVAGASG